MCIIGDFAVGKTAIITRFINNEYEEGLLFDKGISISKKVVPSSRKDRYVKMNIWDVYVRSNNDYVFTNNLKNTAGGLAVCDITRPETADHLKNWLAALKECMGYSVPIVLIGNKFDLFGKNPVSSFTVFNNLKSLDLPFFITTIHLETIVL